MYITPIIPGEHRYPTITPFTIADGQTYLNTLEHLVRMMKDIIDNVNDSNEDLYMLVVGVINTKINEINDALDNQEASVDAKLATLETFVTTTDAELRTYVDNTDNELRSFVNNTDTELRTDVSDAVDQIINSSIELQDNVLSGILQNPESSSVSQLNDMYVKPGELTYFAKDYGLTADGVTDDTDALIATINAAVEATEFDNVTRSATILLPPGIILVSRDIEIDLIVDSAMTTNMRRLVILGAGESNTIIRTAPSYTAGTILDIHSGRVALEGFTIDGDMNFSGTFMRLGKQQQRGYIQQSHLSKMSFTRGAENSTMLELAWCFDTSFSDIQFLNIGENGYGLHIPSHSFDNCNNIIFERCHWEPGRSGSTLTKIQGTSGQFRHSLIQFSSCHWETRNYNVTPIDIELASRLMFSTCTFTVNNSNGASEGVSAEDNQHNISLINVDTAMFLSCGISRIGIGNYAKKLIYVDGMTRAISFENSWLAPSHETSSLNIPNVDNIIEYGPSYNSPLNGIQIINSQVNTRDVRELSPSFNALQSPSSTSTWLTEVDADNDDSLITYFGQATASRPNTKIFSHSRDGGFGSSYRSGIQHFVDDEAQHVFTIGWRNNPSRRALIFLVANTVNDGVLIAYNTGTSLTAIHVGDDISVNTDDVAEKINVDVSEGNIRVTNLYGSGRQVNLDTLGPM